MNLTLAEKMFALKRVYCFAHLGDSDLALIADIAREKELEPGAKLCDAEHILQRCFIVVRGAVENRTGRQMPDMIGVASMLFGMPVRDTLTASQSDGATCLVLNKGHLFTIVYQIPSIICRMLYMSELGTDIAANMEAAQ